MTTATCSLGTCRHDSNCSRTNCEGHPNKDVDLLAQCAASGQLSAAQIEAHRAARELPGPVAVTVTWIDWLLTAIVLAATGGLFYAFGRAIALILIFLFSLFF